MGNSSSSSSSPSPSPSRRTAQGDAFQGAPFVKASSARRQLRLWGTAALVGLPCGILYGLYEQRSSPSAHSDTSSTSTSTSKSSSPVSSLSGSVGMDSEREEEEEFRLDGKISVPSRSAPYPMVSLPTRSHTLQRMASHPFDILVVGGGSAGCGVALDAASRGLSCALIERDDFGSGTSSRSTKLVHGGVRYLEKAVKQLDWSQFALVREALEERSHFFRCAPHLTNRVSILTPVFSYIEVPYLLCGLKLYEWIAGSESLGSSRFLTPEEAELKNSFLDGSGIKGAIEYFDGQFDDTRMNITLALTAASLGASVANHVEVIRFLKDESGRAVGVLARDCITGDTIDIRANVIINATGASSDSLKRLDNNHASDTGIASSGLHLVFQRDCFPSGSDCFRLPKSGLLIPSTEDGRVLFVLPWRGALLAGTTDREAKAEINPSPSREDIEYILRHLEKHVSPLFANLEPSSAWCGIRPLALSSPNQQGTSSVSREHLISVSESGIISIQGGKWTTYRRMAEDAIDIALERNGLLAPEKSSNSRNIKLVGSHTYTNVSAETKKLVEKFKLSKRVARYLVDKYGDLSAQVLEFDPAATAIRLDHPYLWAEVDYALHREFATSTIDVLVNRLRVPFFDAKLSLQLVPLVSARIAKNMNWDATKQQEDMLAAEQYIHKMTDPT